jgi:hypothetical protein
MLNTGTNKNLTLLIIYSFITCFLVGALLIAVWFSRSSYHSLVDFVTATFDRPDLRPLITNSLFTRERYEAIYKFHWTVYPVIITASVYLYYYSAVIYENALLAVWYIQLSFFHVILFFKNLKRYEKISLAIIVAFYCMLVLYNDFQKEISYDEAWGYHYYINKPFYFPLIFLYFIR